MLFQQPDLPFSLELLRFFSFQFVSFQVLSRHVTSSRVIPLSYISHRFMSLRVNSRHFMLVHVISLHVISSPVTLCHLMTIKSFRVSFREKRLLFLFLCVTPQCCYLNNWGCKAACLAQMIDKWFSFFNQAFFPAPARPG